MASENGFPERDYYLEIRSDDDQHFIGIADFTRFDPATAAYNKLVATDGGLRPGATHFQRDFCRAHVGQSNLDFLDLHRKYCMIIIYRYR